MSGYDVTSPAGETITVIDDETFASTLGGAGSTSARISMQWNAIRKAMYAALWHEGVVESPDGRATAVLMERAHRYGLAEGREPKANVFTSPSAVLTINRKYHSARKRTFEIRLASLPERWYRLLLDTEPASSGPLAGIEAPDPPPVPDGAEREGPFPPVSLTLAPATDDDRAAAEAVAAAVLPEAEPADMPAELGIEVELPARVAEALLATVVEIISTGNGAGAELGRLRVDVEGLQERLATATEYGNKLRRELRAAGDEIVALKHERDGLRQRARSAEYNLKVATSGDAQRIIDAEVRRQVDRLMREVPHGQHSKVASG